MKNQKLLGIYLSALVSAVGCQDKMPTLEVFDVKDVPPGEICKYGGLEILRGKDKNNNGALDAEEIDAARTQHACAVLEEGKTARINIKILEAGSECEAGGFLIESGLDKDDSGKLDPQEVESSATLCHGVDGEDGKDGENGKDGQDGEDGKDGEDGYNSLVSLSNLPPDPDMCLFGGTLISSGLDTNKNGTLDGSEVETTSWVCSIRVVDNVIVESTVLLPGQGGTECEEGGIRLIAGVDQNDDHTLQPNEISATTDFCNMTVTIPGKPTLISVANASAQQCQFGGYVYRVGLDDNSNGVLELGEVDHTNLVCNGADGYNSVVNTVPVGINDATPCQGEGGIRFQTGLDTDYDGVLDQGEITHTSYVCNGLQGEAGWDGIDGIDGHNSLISQSSDNGVCGGYGGTRIQSGVDVDDDNILDAGEVMHTSYVCNGWDGANIAVDFGTMNPGATCEYGGMWIYAGPDLDNDEYLDDSEIQSTGSLCNVQTGWIMDYDYFGPDFTCEYGGTELYMGPDINGDGYLTGGEIMNTAIVCDGG